jgi:hypothetical protein
MDVTVLLEPEIDVTRLAEVLDGLGHEGRVHTMKTWGKQRQAALFEAAKAGGKLDLDAMVPASVGPLVEVVHDLHNTLGLPGSNQKRFVKLENEEHKIAGFNVQPWSGLTGPGYFVVYPGEGEHEGEIVFDYTKLPKHKPDSWPAIVSNEGGLSALVFGNMIDYVRRLSSHVSIGRAYKGGKAMDAWFSLVRKDVS